RDQSLRHAAGTTIGAELSLDGDDGFCFYFGGGMHHGQYDFGEGFCPVNDLVIAVRSLQARGRIETAWIIDVDAHKGDGTAALTRNDETIRTLSIHMAQGWPLDQPREMSDGRPNPSYIPSDVDVPVEAGEESTYLPRLEEAMEELERRYPLPDFLLVVDGADPYERDQLPSATLLQMSRDQLLERDAMLYRWFRDRSIPALFVMAGNYGYHSWEIYSQFLERQIAGRLD
ncbi:MAG: histone deacetylase, partial [Firmicutes bacterium]|nr:histone deacetylase [Bacillota bacterium]